MDKPRMNEHKMLLETALNQIFFQYENKFYKPHSGISIGSPISVLITKILLQHLELSVIKHIQDTKRILILQAVPG
jgi:hypothetical protein